MSVDEFDIVKYYSDRGLNPSLSSNQGYGKPGEAPEPYFMKECPHDWHCLKEGELWWCNDCGTLKIKRINQQYGEFRYLEPKDRQCKP